MGFEFTYNKAAHSPFITRSGASIWCPLLAHRNGGRQKVIDIINKYIFGKKCIKLIITKYLDTTFINLPWYRTKCIYNFFQQFSRGISVGANMSVTCHIHKEKHKYKYSIFTALKIQMIPPKMRGLQLGTIRFPAPETRQDMRPLRTFHEVPDHS